MINIAICDDRPEQVEIIRTATNKYFSESDGASVTISEFTNPLDFLEWLDKCGDCDIVLLDICMPGLSGTDVARDIRRRNKEMEIIFLTTSDEFAVDAFAVKAAHYLLKPFTQKEFAVAMDRAMEHYKEKQPVRLLLQIENGVVQAVDVDAIYYVESQLYNRNVHTSDAVYSEQKRSLSSIFEELEALKPKQFIMPYRGYIVNQKAIRTIMTDKIILSNDESIPIKIRDFRKIREAFFAWSFEVRSGR